MPGDSYSGKLLPRGKNFDAARQWILDYLSSHGSTRATVIKEAAERDGFNRGMLERAKQDLNIISKRQSLYWEWHLPPEEGQDG